MQALGLRVGAVLEANRSYVLSESVPISASQLPKPACASKTDFATGSTPFPS